MRARAATTVLRRRIAGTSRAAALAGGVLLVVLSLAAIYYAGVIPGDPAMVHPVSRHVSRRATAVPGQHAVVVPAHHDVPYGELSAGIAYGATPKAVLAKLGPPTTRRKSCWVYRGKQNPKGRYEAPGVDAMEYCFSEGPAGGQAVSEIYSHTVAHTTNGQYIPAFWGHPLVIVRVPTADQSNL